MLINNLNPVAFEIFFIKIHWYSLAYIFGIICGWIYIKKILIKNNIHKIYIDDLITYLIIGIIVGGRLGYVLIYNLKFYLKNPLEIIMIWQGGMSFHGGLIGIIIATVIFCKKNNFSIMKFKKEYLKTLKPLATRKCSEKFLEIVSKLPNDEFYFNCAGKIW